MFELVVTVEKAAAFAVEGAAASAVEWCVASVNRAAAFVTWAVAFVASCDVFVALAGIDKLVDAAAGPSSAARAILAV